MLKAGDKAPEFSLVADNGEKISLKDYKGKKVILYFYPKDMTSGCTQEACDFRDSIKKFEKKNAVVIGVSPDDTKSHNKFKDKYELPFTLLSDESKKMLEDYVPGRYTNGKNPHAIPLSGEKGYMGDKWVTVIR